jgi:predicted HTH transcriptional regulator
MNASQLEMFATGATRFSVRNVEPVTRPQNVHDNSRRTYHEEAATIGKRAMDIMRFYRHCGGAVTDRDCMTALGFTDMNAVRPRITELVKSGLLREVGAIEDRITGKRVRLVEAI